MKITDEYRKNLLAELIEQSAKIDVLVVNSRQATTADAKLSCNQELEELRAKQQETTKRLQELEEPESNVWENIGDGG